MDFDTYYNLYEDLWKKGNYKTAIEIYELLDRPFWWAEDVGKYYEKQGLLHCAMYEYENLIERYLKISDDFLPFPGGPVELFKLGRWYAKTEPVKAEKFLRLYLSAEPDKCGTGKKIDYKIEAEEILKNIQRKN